MFRQMDMREAVLSSAVKRSLLYDSQRNGRFLDTKARVPSCEKPVEKAPLRKAPRVKGRKKPKMTQIERMLMRKVPEPKPEDPFKQLFPNGHKFIVPVCWMEFFQIDCAIRPIKPYSNAWHDVKAPQLVEQLMAEMNTVKSKAKKDKLLHNYADLVELKGHKSKDRSAIDRHIKQVMLSVMAEPEKSVKAEPKENIAAGEMNEKTSNLVAKDAEKTMAADVKTLENGASGEPEMERIEKPKNLSEEKDIGAGDVQQEQIVLAKENSP
ncbi:uncharacterized protein DMAD_01140 [Drosophila madeirensis]|uniref:Uncharacterized protein n=1 Tax=Drosophila madeirensis TaxID=30013 RepID=A0AAU9G0C8_DROMD